MLVCLCPRRHQTTDDTYSTARQTLNSVESDYTSCVVRKRLTDVYFILYTRSFRGHFAKKEDPLFFLDLKRAEVAIASGRLDEAFQVLHTSSEREHRDGQRLVDRLVAALIAGLEISMP